MQLEKTISQLKKIAMLLFLISATSLIGSLLIHNYIIKFNFHYQINYNILPLENKHGSNYTLECDISNEFCTSDIFYKQNAPKSKNLGECWENLVETYVIVKDEEIPFDDALYYEDSPLFIFLDKKNLILKEKYQNKQILVNKRVVDKKNNACIKNHPLSHSMYKIIPIWYNFFAKITAENSGVVLASNETINPFFFGETSISNLAKRYPIYYIFKPLLYISVLLMMIYWLKFDYLFTKLLNKQKNYFFYFGILSAVFLFFHVLFLGMDIENELFQKLRRLIIVMFILSELFAQISLTRQLNLNSKDLLNYCHLNIIKLKIIFIITILIVTSCVLLILIFYNLPSKIDYILEWNYFIVLLFYYFLSSILWKKI